MFAKKPSPNIAVNIPLKIIPDDKKYLSGTLSATMPLLKNNIRNKIYTTIKVFNIQYTIKKLITTIPLLNAMEFYKTCYNIVIIKCHLTTVNITKLKKTTNKNI